MRGFSVARLVIAGVVVVLVTMAGAACTNGDASNDTGEPAPAGAGDSPGGGTPADPPKPPNVDDADADEVVVDPDRATPFTIADAGLETPECVLHDTTADVYLVSNVGSATDPQPAALDGDGFISRLGPGGNVRALRWVDGLNGPKGMAIEPIRDWLIVADIDRLRCIARADGSRVRDIEIPGATFLNGVAIAPGGDGKPSRVYVSDTTQGTIWRVPIGADTVGTPVVHSDHPTCWDRTGSQSTAATSSPSASRPAD
jgi:hypothetical protein